MFSLRVDDEIKLVLLEKRHAKRLTEVIDENRDHFTRWQVHFSELKTETDVLKKIEEWLAQMVNNTGFHAGIYYQGELVGAIGLNGMDHDSQSVSIGYWLAESYQGRGIVRRVCSFVVDYCFNEYNMNRVEISVAIDNHKSRAVPEALGFMQEAILRERSYSCGRHVDLVIYSKLKTDI